MIITKLRIEEEHSMTGPAGTWPLPICDLNLNFTEGENGYVLKEVLGLGPPAMVPVVIGFDTTGIPIIDTAPQKRNLAFKLGLSPQIGQSYSDLRDNFYRMIGRTVFVKLINDSIVIAQITGYIKNVDPVHFSNKPELVVVIECEDSLFSAPSYITIPIASITGLTNPVINYPDGTAPAGIELTFQNLSSSQTGFSISNHSEFWHFGSGDVNNLFQITYPIDNGDTVSIVTHPKSRSVTMYDSSAAAWIDIAGYLNAGAVWPMLYPGVNQFAWSLSWVATWGVTRYIPRYWGV